MVLVDTGIWIDHLRCGESALVGLLERSEVLGHPWVAGELALGRLDRRDEILGLLAGLPQATVAGDAETRALIDRERLWGRGVGWVDVQLLAACCLSGARLWTGDRRLRAVAAERGDAFRPPARRRPGLTPCDPAGGRR